MSATVARELGNRCYLPPLLACLMILSFPPGEGSAAYNSQNDLPSSPVIVSVQWAPPASIIRLGQGSDNWPITWAYDDALYTAYGDGRGFEPFVPKKLSLGLAKVVGSPPTIEGINLRAPSIERIGDGASAPKASGMLMVDDELYLLARNENHARLYWSTDRGVHWSKADWRFTTSFGAPSFVNFGHNYAGARDEFVYILSHDVDSAYEVADAIVLARVPKQQLREQDAWEFFTGVLDGGPRWEKDSAQRKPIIRNPGKCYRSSMSFNSPLKRYLLVHAVPTNATRDQADKPDTRFAGGLAVYDAPEPWGPWTTVYLTDSWDVGPGESCSFPTKWMSDDGKTLHLVFSGDDCFSVRQATFTVAEEAVGQ